MDRLEKALMKARELRETVQPSSAAPVAVPPLLLLISPRFNLEPRREIT